MVKKILWRWIFCAEGRKKRDARRASLERCMGNGGGVLSDGGRRIAEGFGEAAAEIFWVVEADLVGHLADVEAVGLVG